MPDLARLAGFAPAARPMRVHVAARPFTSFGGDLMQKLPQNAKERLVDCGVCHYMVIFEDSWGRFQMFDFGPLGGDVHVGAPSMTYRKNSTRRRKGSVQGEVRHTKLNSLPEACMLVGETDVRLQDVMHYNRDHNNLYELNVNDCRHYVNSVVHLCTGVPNATYRLMQHQFINKRNGRTPTPMDHLVPSLQYLTNPDNWNFVRHSARAVGAAALLSLTHPALLPPLASTSAVAATAVHGVFAVYLQSSALGSEAIWTSNRTPTSTVVLSRVSSSGRQRRSSTFKPLAEIRRRRMHVPAIGVNTDCLHSKLLRARTQAGQSRARSSSGSIK